MTELIISAIGAYCILSFCYFVGTGSYAGHHYFNPIANCEEWNKLNIFGVLVFTLLISILLAPWAMIYWIIKILVAMFTVGRK